MGYEAVVREAEVVEREACEIDHEVMVERAEAEALWLAEGGIDELAACWEAGVL